MLESADKLGGSPKSQGNDWGGLLSQVEGDKVGRGVGSDKERAGGGREAGFGFGGSGGAEELLDRAVRNGLPLHSRRRSEDEWEVSSGGSGG